MRCLLFCWHGWTPCKYNEVGCIFIFLHQRKATPRVYNLSQPYGDSCKMFRTEFFDFFYWEKSIYRYQSGLCRGKLIVLIQWVSRLQSLHCGDREGYHPAPGLSHVTCSIQRDVSSCDHSRDLDQPSLHRTPCPHHAHCCITNDHTLST